MPVLASSQGGWYGYRCSAGFLADLFDIGIETMIELALPLLTEKNHLEILQIHRFSGHWHGPSLRQWNNNKVCCLCLSPVGAVEHVHGRRCLDGLLFYRSPVISG
jgi:hypothetical protein